MNARGRLLCLLLLTYTAILSGCATYDATRDCTYNSASSFIDAIPNSLTLVVGAPHNMIANAFVAFHKAKHEASESSITLNAIATPMPWPEHIDESSCSRVDWVTYSLAMKHGDWGQFWDSAKLDRFQIGVTFQDTDMNIGTESFGMVLIDSETGHPLVSCGCISRDSNEERSARNSTVRD